LNCWNLGVNCDCTKLTSPLTGQPGGSANR
jgi:hypothetical protein